MVFNNFLQMFYSNHSYTDSLNLFEPSSKNRRYLTRSRYIGELSWNSGSNITVFTKIEHNSRGVDISSFERYKWQNIELGVYLGKIKIGTGVFSHANKNSLIFDFLGLGLEFLLDLDQTNFYLSRRSFDSLSR